MPQDQQLVQLIAIISVFVLFGAGELAIGKFFAREATTEDNRLDAAINLMFPVVSGLVFATSRALCALWLPGASLPFQNHVNPKRKPTHYWRRCIAIQRSEPPLQKRKLALQKGKLQTQKGKLALQKEKLALEKRKLPLQKGKGALQKGKLALQILATDSVK